MLHSWVTLYLKRATASDFHGRYVRLVLLTIFCLPLAAELRQFLTEPTIFFSTTLGAGTRGRSTMKDLYLMEGLASSDLERSSAL